MGNAPGCVFPDIRTGPGAQSIPQRNHLSGSQNYLVSYLREGRPHPEDGRRRLALPSDMSAAAQGHGIRLDPMWARCSMARTLPRWRSCGPGRVGDVADRAGAREATEGATTSAPRVGRVLAMMTCNSDMSGVKYRIKVASRAQKTPWPQG